MVSFNKIIGDENNNDLRGTPQSDQIVGLAGNDALSGFLGDDLLEGGLGNDWLDGDAGSDTIDGGDGVDWVNYGRDLNDPNAIGSHGVYINLELGEAKDNWSYTDKLISIEGAIGSNYDDTIIGNSADNNIIGNAGDDTIHGKGGNDWLIGWTGSDTIYGDAGDDWLEAGSGADFIDGGDGIDWLNYENEDSDPKYITGKGVTVDLEKQSAVDNWGNEDKILNVENVTGSRFSDLLIGNASNNFLSGQADDDDIYGAAGNDWLIGGAGNDHLFGGVGDDYLQGDSGSDIIDGGNGSDWITYSSYKSLDPAILPDQTGVILDLESGLATDNWGSVDTIINTEHIIGSSLNDQLSGDSASNCIMAGLGNDTIIGRDGSDWLLGQEGDDTLVGGNGSDWLEGGQGSDISTGGADIDFFVYNSLTDFGGKGSKEIITDFSSNSDVIVLSKIDANSMVSGDQSFVYSNTNLGAGTVWFQEGVLYGDVDGGGADFQIELLGVSSDLLQRDIIL